MLSRREVQCLEWLGRGLHDRDIAKQIGVTRPTVRFHLGGAKRKLNARTREQALVMALKRGLIDP